MTPPPRSAARAPRSPRTADGSARPGAVATALAGWFVPGAGHALQGQAQKAAVFALVLILMFAIGLGLGGRLFAFQTADPLTFLVAAAEWGALGPRAIGALTGLGRGDVVAVTYEYGNAFLIASGLLNVLVILDAVDLTSGRKPQ